MTESYNDEGVVTPLRPDLAVLLPAVARQMLIYNIEGVGGESICSAYPAEDPEFAFELAAENEWGQRPGADETPEADFDEDLAAMTAAIKQAGGALAVCEAFLDSQDK